MRQLIVAVSLVIVAAVPASGAETPAAPPDDLDALKLADQAPAETAQRAQAWRVFVEGAVGKIETTGPDGRVDTRRAALDARFDANLAPGLRAVFSDRLDLAHSSGAAGEENVNTLREAYLSWARTEDQILDFGRVNIRHGVALGYNPTDWFKENALRFIVSPDPAVLRENRQGTVVLQGQKLGSNGAVTAAYSPKLGSSPSSDTFSLNAGATNPRDRWLLTGSYKFAEKFAPQLLLYGGADTPTQAGLNLSALISDSAVVFGEFAIGRDRSLAARALGLAAARHQQTRGAVGATYTTPFNLTVTAEAEYNGAAPDRDQWNALPALDPLARLQVLGTAQALQDLPVRRALFIYATWKDVVVRRLDLSAFVRREMETNSRAQWLEARYRWERADLALQWLSYAGHAGSVYRTIPERRSVELILRFYL
jgi:hypothetical protein